MLSRVLLLVCVLMAVSWLPQEAGAFDPMDKSFFKHYANMKILCDCFGMDKVMEWHHKLEDCMRECHDELHDPATHKEHFYKPAKESEGKKPYYSAEKVRFIKNKIMEKVDFVNCTMNKMNITMTPAGGVDTAEMVKYFDELQINETLKIDIKEGIEKCGRISECIEVEGYGPIDTTFRKKIKFLKCKQRTKVLSCVKEDLRQYRDQFDFEGLDGMLDDVEQDADKMLAISSAKAALERSFLFF